MTFAVSAPDAGSVSCEADTRKRDSAPCRVLRAIEHDERRAVYDLTVEDAHEFFANGVLVHNSMDELKYVGCALLDMGQPKSRRPGPSPEQMAAQASGFVGLGSRMRERMVNHGRAGHMGEAYRRVHAA